MQEIHLKQQQSQLLAFIFALCSNTPNERLVGELGAFELMKEFDEYTLNLAVDFYSALKIKTEAYTQGAH
ncbi:hypothetical protein [Pseudomonas sp. TAE6080]|uniref:hypothetical protein n=1 Tax=Pseudomonas sp. TAE6080 TaxID=2840374 RepID=UPI001C006660|nr:hypothetical protein [Pseudomonas sp. TAE6080]MBT9302904.1 hypothetical protein [Pseudomonas sp. TAE6080]